MIMNYNQDGFTIKARTDDDLKFVISDINFDITAYTIIFKVTNGDTITDFSESCTTIDGTTLSINVISNHLASLIISNTTAENKYTIVADLGNGSTEFIMGGIFDIESGI